MNFLKYKQIPQIEVWQDISDGGFWVVFENKQICQVILRDDSWVVFENKIYLYFEKYLQDTKSDIVLWFDLEFGEEWKGELLK